MLAEGDVAPDFELPGSAGGERRRYRLSEFADADEWVLIAFYAFDFNPICTTGMCALRDAEFFGFYDDLSPIGISGDGLFAHEAFAERYDVTFPLLADTDRSVGDDYGVVCAECQGMRRIHRRAVFVVDPERTVRVAAAIDADSPEDIDLAPLNAALRDVRAD